MNEQKYRKQNSLKFDVKNNLGPSTLYYYSLTVKTQIHRKGDRKKQFIHVKQLNNFSHKMALFTSFLLANTEQSGSKHDYIAPSSDSTW